MKWLQPINSPIVGKNTKIAGVGKGALEIYSDIQCWENNLAANDD